MNNSKVATQVIRSSECLGTSMTNVRFGRSLKRRLVAPLPSSMFGGCHSKSSAIVKGRCSPFALYTTRTSWPGAAAAGRYVSVLAWQLHASEEK